MLNLNSIQVGTMNVRNLAEFYEGVFNQKPDSESDGWVGWTVGETYFSVYEHSEIDGTSTDPARIMFNFETNDVETEFNRIKDLGATVVREPYQIDSMWVATFADPDGNYFQLMSPWAN